jgi:hypothetical protein
MRALASIQGSFAARKTAGTNAFSGTPSQDWRSRKSITAGKYQQIQWRSKVNSRPRYHILRRGSRSKQRHKRAPATTFSGAELLTGREQLVNRSDRNRPIPASDHAGMTAPKGTFTFCRSATRAAPTHCAVGVAGCSRLHSCGNKLCRLTKGRKYRHFFTRHGLNG